MKRNDCDNFPDTVIIGLCIEMSNVILNALYKYRLFLLLSASGDKSQGPFWELQYAFQTVFTPTLAPQKSRPDGGGQRGINVATFPSLHCWCGPNGEIMFLPDNFR